MHIERMSLMLPPTLSLSLVLVLLEAPEGTWALQVGGTELATDILYVVMIMIIILIIIIISAWHIRQVLL